MGAMQAILREMELPTPATLQRPQQRYVVSPRHWVMQRREAQLRPQHLRVRILKQQHTRLRQR